MRIILCVATHEIQVDLPLSPRVQRLMALLASRSAQRVLQTVLEANEVGVGITDLQASTGLSQPTLSRLVGRLAGAGLLHSNVLHAFGAHGRPPVRWRAKDGPEWEILRAAARAPDERSD